MTQMLHEISIQSTHSAKIDVNNYANEDKNHDCVSKVDKSIEEDGSNPQESNNASEKK